MGKKTAIVTGASRGIGYAIAKQLGLDGYQVVMLATGAKEKYAEAFEKLTEQDITWHYVQGSIDCAQDRRRLLDETLARFGRVDVLVNNAGVAPLERKDILEMSEESFDRVMGINTKGTLFLTQLVANQMLKQEWIGKKRGTIVNVGSCSAKVSSTSRGEYCISKAGVAMITQLFADRLAPEGILVHEVHRYDQRGEGQIRRHAGTGCFSHQALGNPGGCGGCGESVLLGQDSLYHGKLSGR